MAEQPMGSIAQLSPPAHLLTHFPKSPPITAPHPKPSSNATSPLLSLSNELTIHLASHLHTLRDFISLSSTCACLRIGLSHANPRDLLRLARTHQQRRSGPLPTHHLLLAVARDLGAWARLSRGNEALLVEACREGGVRGLLSLATATRHANCGLTLERARELHSLQRDVFPRVREIVDGALEDRNRVERDFWGSADEYEVDWDGGVMVYQIAIYGEMFGQDMETFLERGGEGGEEAGRRMLAIETRLEFVRYCIPNYYDPSFEFDSASALETYGPVLNHTLAMCCALTSRRWMSTWKQIRTKVGGEDFFVRTWGFERTPETWKQEVWEATWLCWGLPGLRMIVSKFQENESQKVGRWREKIRDLKSEGRHVSSSKWVTWEWPCLLHDLDVCLDQRKRA